MSRVKKAKFTASSSTDFKAFLKNPGLEPDYQRISQLEIIPSRFVNFNDFMKYDITSYLQNTGLYELFSIEDKQGYHLSLIYLFFTNLTYEDDDNSVKLSTLVNGVDIN